MYNLSELFVPLALPDVGSLAKGGLLKGPLFIFYGSFTITHLYSTILFDKV